MSIKKLRERRAAYQSSELVRTPSAILRRADALACYEEWLPATCIISDGPYGLGKFPGEPADPKALPYWYAPHIAAWSRFARPDATLWFWNTELGWALVHPILDLMGWDYQECCVWDKGLAHVAGNCNSKTIRGLPVVTEVAVRYTKRNRLPSMTGELLSIKEWVRAEWLRSGLPMNRANEACGVKNAATRKYLTQCHLWYFPPAEAMVQMAAYCARYGKKTSRPYFSLDGATPLTASQWNAMRSKWNHVHGVTNVWRENAVHGEARYRGANGYLHANQKPLSLMAAQIAASTDKGDVIWEPFGGLCTATVASILLERRAFAAEISDEYFMAAAKRILQQGTLLENAEDAA